MLFGSSALIVGRLGLFGRGRKSHSYFHSLCYLSKWGRGVSPIFHLAVLVWIKVTKRQGEFKITLCNSSRGKILRGILSYWAESHLESNQTSTVKLPPRKQPTVLIHWFFPRQTLPSIPHGLRLDSRCRYGV